MGTVLKELFRSELSLCEVGPGQKVVVLSEGDQLQDYIETSLSVASELGAKVVNMNLPSLQSLDPNSKMANIGVNPLSNHPSALAECCNADMVIDHMLLLFSKEQIKMQNQNTRVLLVVEPPEVLERLFPSPKLRHRVETAEGYLRNANELRFKNEVGTDITYRLGNKSILTEYGYTCSAGRWDHWPGGFLATLAIENGVNGRVVMNEKDIIFPLKKFVESPIEFIIENSKVIEINGDSDAKNLKKYIDEYNDPRAYAVSHIGWGLNEACQWNPSLPGIGMDGRAFHGNVLFSLGPDTEFGGKNDTQCHLDLPMQNCSLSLDGELIIDAGEIIPVSMRA